MVTAICNVFINSDLKLSLFKQTFPRVYGVSDNWLVNIRGKYRDDVLRYIRETFPDPEKNCVFFSGLDDTDWAKSTRKMLSEAKHDRIYVFLEDHFLLKPLDHFRDVIRDMAESGVEYFCYSFFDVGVSMRNSEGLYPEYSRHLFSFRLGKRDLDRFRRTNRDFYPYSLAGVCTKEYFRKLLDIEDKSLIKVPFLIQALMENVFFFYPRNRAFWHAVNRAVSWLNIRFVIYPSATPFNLEKSLFDCDEELLPLRAGGLKEELFANWDDDNKLSNSSLIKRGLYPERFRIESQVVPKAEAGREYVLAEGGSSSHQYCPDVSRVEGLPKKYIRVKEGELEITSERESFILREGESAWVSANVPHKLLSRGRSVFQVYIDSGL